MTDPYHRKAGMPALTTPLKGSAMIARFRKSMEEKDQGFTLIELLVVIVIIGLLLYSFVLLPLFVPVMVKTFGKANWWPFMDNKFGDTDH